MFVCFLLAGIGLALTVGLLDVLVLHVDVLKTQNHVGGGLDLALGIPLLAIGALLATGHLHRRRPRSRRQNLKYGSSGRCMSRITDSPSLSVTVLRGSRRFLSPRAAPPDQ